jgi:Flp pilus assembly protein TadG
MQRVRNQRGQSLLEFALLAPFVLFFLLALVDFGIAIDRRIVLDHAVREGARFASVGGDALDGDPATKEQVVSYTKGQAQSLADGDPVDVCNEQSGNFTAVRVSVDHTYNFVTGFASIFDSELTSIDMHASASARVEKPIVGVDAC